MNYRHAYHAGNFGDVLKHLVLVAILEHLGRKPQPYFYLDTHAGRGSYPLADPDTQRGGEYRNGILKLIEAHGAPEAVARYLEVVRELGWEGSRLTAYPGSPRIALNRMRGDDRAAFCELEPTEADALRAELRGDHRAAVHWRDGYEALGALLPPREKRGLVLIDPAYEDPDEFEVLRAALVAAATRWPVATFMVWYPIKHGGDASRFLGRMETEGLRRQLLAELCVQRDDTPGGLNGAGVLLLNPPWQLDARLAPALAWVLARLAPPQRGRSRVSWLVPE